MPGIGIGINGETLIVDDHVQANTTTITGHLDDGTYPQRDYTVQKDGQGAHIDGVYDWQKMGMVRNGNKLGIKGETDRESSEVTSLPKGLVVDSPYPGKRYSVTDNGFSAWVQGYSDVKSANIVFFRQHDFRSERLPGAKLRSRKTTAFT